MRWGAAYHYLVWLTVMNYPWPEVWVVLFAANQHFGRPRDWLAQLPVLLPPTWPPLDRVL